MSRPGDAHRVEMWIKYKEAPMSVLQVTVTPEGTARLSIPLRMRDRDYRKYVVPAGFTTDFVSSPRWLWWIVPPLSRASRAAVVHDYLYGKRLGTRKAADVVFLRLLERCFVPKWKRYAMYAAVRAFGWMSWRAAR